MAVSNIVLNIVTKGADLAKRQLDGIGKTGDKSSKGLAKFGKAMGTTAVAGAVALGKALQVAGREFIAFEDAMTQSLAIMNATEQQQRAMEQTAREVALTTTFSAEQTAQSFFFLASAGLDAEQQIQALPQVAKFAQAGMFDMATATDLATDAQSALGLTVSDAGQNLENLTRVTDVLVKANTLANASVQQFSEALTSKAGSALKVVNKDIEEGVAVLAVFADAGVKGAEGGEKLNQVLRDIPRATAKNGEEFAKLGLEMFDAEGNMRNVADIVEELDRVLKPMSDELKASTLDQLGLNRGVADAVKILSGSTEKIREYEKALRDSGGTTEDVAGNQLESLKSQLILTGDKFSELGLIIVEELTPALSHAIDVTNGLLDIMIGRVPDTEEFAHSINFITKALNFLTGTSYDAEIGTKALERAQEKIKNQDLANMYKEYADGVRKSAEEQEEQDRITRDQIRNAHRYEIESYNLIDTLEDQIEVTQELSDEEKELIKLREDKGIDALNKVFNAYQKIEDIKQNIIDLEQEERDRLEELNSTKLSEEDAVKKVDQAEQELARQKELSKEVTLEETIAIKRQEEQLNKLREMEERSELQNLELQLAEKTLTELRIASESATRDEERAEQDLIRALEDQQKATDNVAKAQEEYRKQQEEVAKATDGSTDEILEMAIAKAELDKALADATGLGTFTDLVSLMADDVTGDLQSVIDKFLEIQALGSKPITVGDGGGGGGGVTAPPVVPPEITADTGLKFDPTGAVMNTGDTGSGSSFAGSDAFGTITYQTNNFNLSTGDILSTEQEVENRVMSVIEKAQKRGLSLS